LAAVENKVGKAADEASFPANATGAESAPVQTKRSPDALPKDEEFTILWVDDTPSNNAFLVEQFQKDGIDVKLARSTDEGITDFGSGDCFSMIVTDLGRREGGRMNWFAGLDLIKKVREISRDVPILVFASPRAAKYRDRLLEAGASAVSHSAVEVQSFVASVRSRSP
jgi:CheY-like chemotaxis protein